MAVAGVPGWDRRLDAVLNFTCESGHAWEMRLAQHKGYTEIFIEESV
jgi:hypothetical protein